jgi:glycine cleavage system H protein
VYKWPPLEGVPLCFVLCDPGLLQEESQSEGVIAMKLDPEARYAGTHEWVKDDGDEMVCGITDHAQDSLSDVVYVELPEIGDELEQGDAFGVVESVKAASDLYMPMGGKINAVNTALEDTPELVNQDPYGAGWMIRFTPSNLAELDDLMDGEAYEASVTAEEG